MTQPTRTAMRSILMGDELGQIKLVQLDPQLDQTRLDISDKYETHESSLQQSSPTKYFTTSSASAGGRKSHRHRIVRVLSDCLQKEPAASRAITNIRPISTVHERHLDTTDKPNSLFLITNKVGQIFVCDTDAVRQKLSYSGYPQFGDVKYHCNENEVSSGADEPPMLSPIYYDMNNKVPVCGAQPINQTNILVIYHNGDIQHVNIGQDILRSSLKIKRKAIRMLGLGYNSDAKAVQWRIDGSTGVCYFETDSSATHLKENDPLTDIVLSSPSHKLNKKRTLASQQNLFNQSPCIQSRKCNEHERLVPTQVINMITSRSDQYKPSSRTCKWSSITSLNLIYRKLALYDLVGSENFERFETLAQYRINSYKLNDNRLAVGGNKYSIRVYDVQTQKAIYNSITGSSKNPLSCSSKGEPTMVGDLDWIGGNKTIKRPPDMLATCSGVDSIVKVFDLRSAKPVFYIDLTQETQNKWQPYENHPRGCMFTSICASGAPYSTAVPSQQLALGSTNGQLHVIDLRFVAKSQRSLGKLSGFCGGSIREIRFVSESFESSKMISCATDRFIRIHRVQTSFTSVISQKLATKVFLGTKPTCIQPVCDEVSQSYLALSESRFGSESHLSTLDSCGWSLL